MDIQAGFVKKILDSVVSELSKDQRRKFNYVEMAFFSNWWNEQNDTTKHKVYIDLFSKLHVCNEKFLGPRISS